MFQLEAPHMMLYSPILLRRRYNTAGDSGGIANVARGSLTVINSTIVDNWAELDGGGIGNRGATLNMQNGILAGNSANYGQDLWGRLTSSGYNLIGNIQGGSGFVDTDLLNVNPLLGPLQNNGGPTMTMGLLAGSPALNAGDPAQLGVADQRGVVRSGGVNIGAYQASASAFVLTTPATTTAGTPFNVTVKAVDTFGQTALGYTGTVTFSTTDTNPAVVLPANYTFTTADAGLHTFTGGATLASAGSQTLTATDTMTSSLTGSATIAVTPAAADHFVLSVPTGVTSGTAFDVMVTVVDAYGNTVPTYLGTVTFSSTDQDPGVLLPADYTFQASDSGSHVFTAGVTLITPGDETLTVTDTGSGLSGSITVHL
jgi:hypothetical protein